MYLAPLNEESLYSPSDEPRPLMALMAIKWLPENGWKAMMSS
jgi:hypothetical protein